MRLTSDGNLLISAGNLGIGQSAPVAKLHIGAETEANLTMQGLFVQGTKAQYASVNGLIQNQLCVYDDTASTAGSGGGISFGANTGSSQRTWLASIEARRDSATNDATNYAGSLVFYTRPAQSPTVERMRITSAGNVGINGTPTYKFDVGINSQTQSATVGSNGLIRNATAADTSPYTQARIIVYGGTSVDTANWGYFAYGADANMRIVYGKIGSASGPSLIFGTTSAIDGTGAFSESMRIDGSGNLLVGKTTTSTGTQGVVLAAGTSSFANSSGTASINMNNIGFGGISMSFQYSGSQKGYIEITSTAVNYVTSSDQRLKTNIVDAPEGNIDSIKVRSFDWLEDGSHQTYGMVAQELLTSAPYAVSQSSNSEDMMGVDYSKLVPMLVKEIQSLRARVAQLETKGELK